MRHMYQMMKAFLFSLVLVLTALGANAQAIEVQGRVTSADDGEGVPGASVVIKGTTNGVSTDYDGNFTLKAKSTDILVISFVGYTTQEILVGSQTRIDVVLQSDFKALDEVVVIGYGVQKKSDATGSVEQISASDFNQGAITSPAELISGKSPGVVISTEGGAPGSGATIRIRGGSSLSASSDPLFVIDGIPVDNGGVAGARNPL
ncbi:MAG: carboxypeptidase-like regulatory domain-containing protein, partial [Cytophagales bacterium]|nr:carboxypeptidase-like regulatory domain-containing protein [Cytophagales bacterium]